MKNSALAAGVRRLRGLMALQDRHDDSDEQLLHAFTTQHDDIAFAALVRRYGPLVMGVCRRVLRQAQDAEDAFQATFLVLARNADKLRNKNALASWLHGAAYRLALTAKRAAARRRIHESRAAYRPQSDPAEELSWRETQAMLDEEIARLPEIYRSVFVLCYLESVSREEAARRLGLNEGTVSSRLTAARKRLAKRLTHRGVELTALLAASALATQQASALSLALMAKTVEAALGEGLPCMIPAAVAELVRDAPAAMMASKAKIAAFVLLAMSLLTVATSGALMSWFGRPSGPLPAAKIEDKPRTPFPKREATNSVQFKGRVLDPDGKPKAGAKLRLLSEKGRIELLGATTAEGRFSIAVPKRTRHSHLIAQADGAGMDFIDLGPLKPAKPIELRLVKDNVIRGRVVNTEGKPIRGVSVTITRIDAYPNNLIETFLIRWPKRGADHALPPGEKTVRFRAPSLLVANTDKDGRFAIPGVGVERVAELAFHGGGIADTSMWIANRDGFDSKPYNRPADDAYRSAPKRLNPPPLGILLQGPNATIIAEPEKPIRGTVTDADSGKGVANVSIRLEQEPTDVWRNFPTAKTDAQGRYEFHGARKTKTYPFYIDSDSSTGYLPTQLNTADTVGYAPLTVNLRIKKGVIVTGKVIDRATGKSVPGFAQFKVLVDNPFVKDYPPFGNGLARKRENTAADGTFRVSVIPGPVLLMGGYYPPPTEKFDYIEFSKYRPPIADPQYPKYFPKLPSRSDVVGYLAYPRGIGVIQGNYCKVLDIKPGTATVHQDILLDRASVLPVKIQDAEDHPVAGVWASDFASHPYIGPLWIEESTCPVYELEARKPRQLIFYEPKRKIIGSRKLKGDEKTPLTVKLGSMASLKGRLLDADGKPLAGIAVEVFYRESEAGKLHRLLYGAKQIITDADGAFALDDLIPELKFELAFCRGKVKFERETKAAAAAIKIEPGERRDLGAFKVKQVREGKNSD